MTPPFLYKYKPAINFADKNRHPDFLESGLLRMTPPSEFNDPFEGLYNISDTNEFAEEIVKGFDYDKIDGIFDSVINERKTTILNSGLNRAKKRRALAAIRKNNLRKKTNKKIGASLSDYTPHIAQKIIKKSSEINTSRDNYSVLCLSENENDITMWAHYASEGNGYLIEFNTSKTILANTFNKTGILYEPKKVSYSKSKSLSLTSPDSNFNPFIIKHDNWSYEKEWRMIGLSKDLNKFECSQNIGLVRINPAAVESIVLGYHLKAKELELYKNLLKIGPFKNTKIKHAKVNSEKLEIEYYEI